MPSSRREQLGLSDTPDLDKAFGLSLLCPWGFLKSPFAERPLASAEPKLAPQSAQGQDSWAP